MKARAVKSRVKAGTAKRWMKAGAAYMILFVVVAAFAVWWLLQSMAEITAGASEAGLQQLEQAIWRAAVVCYATEGRYPPDIQYLEENYGIQINARKYIVEYQVYAQNMMPDITVLEAGDAE